MLANAEGVPKVKSLPNIDFVVSEKSYNEIKLRVKLSKEVDKFIKSSIE